VPGEHHAQTPDLPLPGDQLKNKEYNPGSRFAASEYEFPYADASYDFVLLTSVFKKLLPDEVENYLSKVERVL
jgi:hypothetical protein